MPEIEGGYILLARTMLKSDLMDKPALWTKLWVWMLLRARRLAGSGFEVGELHTSIEEMREAMAYMVGYRKMTPTSKEIRKAYEGLAKGTMIVTTKVTRGMRIKVLNYEHYQNPKNYEGHNEGHNERATKGKGWAHYKQEGFKNDKKENQSSSPKPMEEGSDFEKFWKAYPRKIGKSACLKKWNQMNGTKPPLEKMLAAVEAQKASPQWVRDGGQYIPHPLTWLNQGRWDDEGACDLMSDSKFAGAL